MLELRSVGKRIGSFELRDISMTLAPGEYFVLLGPSGIGKTVLIEIIAGLIRPDTGSVLYGSRDITADPPETRGFAIVYQDYALFPHMSVARNITYGLRATGLGREEAARRLERLAGMLQIGGILDRRPGKLSGGEQQRVALARALVTQPKLLLLDEPLSALDTNTRRRLRKELKRISRDLATPTLHVTHDPNEAIELGDRIGVMLDRSIRQIAPADTLFREPSDAKVAEFLGMRNILTVDRVEGSVCLACGVEIHVGSVADSTSHIWVKPEEILLSRRRFDSSARNQFKCKVVDWRNIGSFQAVRAAFRQLTLTALITHESFNELEIQAGSDIYITFKSSSVHCF